MKNEHQYYFSHDANAKDDPKCILLIEQLGCEGYGIFWILVETLRSQDDFRYPLKLVPALARRFNTSAEKMLAVIKGYELFIIDDDEFFYSQSFNERMQIYLEMKEKRSIAGKIGMSRRWGDKQKTPLLQTHNTVITENNKEKENKIKDIYDTPATLQNIQTLMIRTFGRNPTIPEQELIENEFIRPFGWETTYRLFKDASLRGFKKLVTLRDNIEIINNKPQIKERENERNNQRPNGRTQDKPGRDDPGERELLERLKNRPIKSDSQ